MLTTSIRKNSLILGVFALITAALLAATYDGTRDKIAAAERHAAQKALLEIVPKSRHNNDLLNDTLAILPNELANLGLHNPDTVYRARQDGKVVAVIVPTIAPDAYSGAVKMIVGVNRDGSVAGVRILNHNETPGLGDKVDLKKSPWVLSFDGKSLSNPQQEKWKVKKDGGEFDQFTGATITPRAVVKQVKHTLAYVQRHHDKLFDIATTANTNPQSTAAKVNGHE